ncbi:MAG: AmmeMemoRadiSam system radical SAM enzyme [Deltaproteobacteria bacterium]|nr:MAG: AmmeMemoRadiSam system radical SAM enzyme [Deltaproteobacteria bacterium]
MKRHISRKEFLKEMGLLSLFVATEGHCFWPSGKNEEKKDIRGHVFKNDAPKDLWKWSIEGFHYTTNGKDVQCMVCPNRCYLRPGDRSVCRSKVNIGGKLYSVAYGNRCAIHIDPIEKKPLSHFHPATSVFSIAAAGCNFRCLNCQNWEISQRKPEEVNHYELFPADVVRITKEKNIPSIAYTYSEPISYYEYMYDTAKLASAEGIKNVLVSNGYINRKPLEDLAQYLDAANVNLKSYDDDIYRRLNGGTLQPVLNTFRLLHEKGVWFEMTTLVVPGYVDKPEMTKRMCGWILKELGPDYPLHFLRFFPHYKLDRLPATPVKTLELLRNIALREGIHYVYLGNVPGHDAYNTYCHNCQKILIRRIGYEIGEFNLNAGRCKFCNTPIPGRWGI